MRTKACLVKVKNEVQLTNVLKSPVQGFHKYLENGIAKVSAHELPPKA